VLSAQDQLHLGRTQEFGPLLSDNDIVFQADVTIVRHGHAQLHGIDVPGFQRLVRAVAIALPFGTQDPAAIVRQPAQVMARGVHILGIAGPP